MSNIQSLKNGKSPQLHDSVFLSPGVHVIGDVKIGEQSSVWFGSVIRGDVNWIEIGKRCNIQDLSMLHVTHKTNPLKLGNDVTVGHKVVLHGCTIEDRVLIGMGSIVMDGAIVKSDSIVGAGSVVTPGTVIPSNTLALGSPARVKRELKPEEKAFLKQSAQNYIDYQDLY